jgi:hypothetical protein
MDSYRLPDAKGFTAMLWYLRGETDEARQKRRDMILSTTEKDFQSFGQWLHELSSRGHVVVMGSATAMDQAMDSGLKLDHVWRVL